MSQRYIPDWEHYGPGPASQGYLLRLTNGLSVPIPLVLVRAARQLRNLSVLRVENMAPGAEVVLPLGTIAQVSFYEIGLFDEHGHMLGHGPSGLESYHRSDTGAGNVTVLDSHVDGVVIGPDLLLAPDAEYTVNVHNKTPDTWDEVTLSYGSAVDGTVLLASSPVSPDGKASFPVGRVQDLDGYQFSVWVNGLRAELAEGALAFPPSGLMTAARAVEFSWQGEMNPNQDDWIIGSDE